MDANIIKTIMEPQQATIDTLMKQINLLMAQKDEYRIKAVRAEALRS